MATNCDYIEDNVKPQQITKSAAATATTEATNASSTMSEHAEKQDGREKEKEMAADCQLHQLLCDNQETDSFECAFESTMDDLEQAVADGYESDSEASANGRGTADSSASSLSQLGGLGGLQYSQQLTPQLEMQLQSLPRVNSFDFQSSSSGSSSDNENDDDDDDVDDMGSVGALNLSAKFARASDARYDLFHQRPPYLLPSFQERRRLSQCKEEDDEDDGGDKSPPVSGDAPRFERASKAPPRPPTPQDAASKEKFRELERLRQQFMHKIDRINTQQYTSLPPPPPPPPPPIPATILPKALKELLQSSVEKVSPPATPVQPAVQPEAATVSTPPATPPATPTAAASHLPLQLPHSADQAVIIKGKFKVTRAQETPQLRVEAQQLRELKPSANAQTISFPSSFGGYSSVQGLFSQRYGSHRFPAAQPHLSKQFFDSSLVEIRASNASLNHNQSLNCDSSSNASSLANKPRTPSERELDEIWIRRGPALPGAMNASSNASPTPSASSAQTAAAVRPVSLGGAATMPRLLLRNESSNSATISPSRQLATSGSVSVSVSEDVSWV